MRRLWRLYFVDIIFISSSPSLFAFFHFSSSSFASSKLFNMDSLSSMSRASMSNQRRFSSQLISSRVMYFVSSVDGSMLGSLKRDSSRFSSRASWHSSLSSFSCFFFTALRDAKAKLSMTPRTRKGIHKSGFMARVKESGVVAGWMGSARIFQRRVLVQRGVHRLLVFRLFDFIGIEGWDGFPVTVPLFKRNRACSSSYEAW